MSAHGELNIVRPPARQSSGLPVFLLVMAVLASGTYESWAVLFQPGASIERALVGWDANRLTPAEPTDEAPQPLILDAPAQVYSVEMDPLWLALPGERYTVVTREPGWALAVRESDPPEMVVWIEFGHGSRTSPPLETPAQVPVVLATVLAGLGLAYGVTRLLRTRAYRDASSTLAARRPLPLGLRSATSRKRGAEP